MANGNNIETLDLRMTPPSSPIQADTIVAPSWLISVNKDFDILEHHALVIDKDKIIDILPAEQARSRYQGDWQDLTGHALLPGFVNTHNHAAMSLLKGFAEDKSLQSWLNDYIWPTEGKWMGEEFVRDGSLLACAEMIRSGTTTFNDMYFFPDVSAQIAESCHMRACLSFPILEFPSAWANNANEYIDKGLDLHDQYRSHPMISTAFGPHAPYTVSLATMERISVLSEELDSNIHIHLHENQQEVVDYTKEHGQSAIEHWAKLGFLGPRLQAVHMTQLSSQEIDLIKTHNVNVIHCPESNMKLASGIAPIQALLEAGIHVSLGTDGCASNNDMDMLGEMKSAALLAKVSTGNPAALNAEQVLRMATIDGARSLGLDTQCGSLEVGKAADCISIDLSSIECMPLYHVVSQIIYSTSKSHISNVWIAGKQVLKNKALTLIDEQALIKKAQYWQTKISANSFS